MKRTKIIIAVSGVLLPYVARVPGALIKGPVWFTTFVDQGIGGFAFFAVLNAIFWGSIILAVSTYRYARSAWFPAALGFLIPAIGYATVDLRSSSTAALSLIFIPLFSLPLILIGWLVGLRYEARLRSRGISQYSR